MLPGLGTLQHVTTGWSALDQLSRALLEYGQQQRNPVLDILPADQPFRVNQKYPEARLHFGEDQWRAYYHSHDVPGGENLDHGHFHVFARVERTGDVAVDWSHVAGLGMDNSGQPTRWFTVNNWVTGDHWLPAEQLIENLRFDLEESTRIGRWLLAMMGFYCRPLLELLQERDGILGARGVDVSAEILTDRDIYFLSDRPIDLVSDLTSVLDQEA